MLLVCVAGAEIQGKEVMTVGSPDEGSFILMESKNGKKVKENVTSFKSVNIFEHEESAGLQNHLGFLGSLVVQLTYSKPTTTGGFTRDQKNRPQSYVLDPNALWEAQVTLMRTVEVVGLFSIECVQRVKVA
jgi:hypothetical protein